jgi:hypothetical protein
VETNRRKDRDPLPWSQRPLLNHFYALNIDLLINERWLTPGRRFVWGWGDPCQASVHIHCFEDAVELAYRSGSGREPVRERVPLIWKSCHYGGMRPYFTCLACGKKYRKLFLKEGFFRCRDCHGLAYKKVRSSEVDGEWAQRLREQAGGLLRTLRIPSENGSDESRWEVVADV